MGRITNAVGLRLGRQCEWKNFGIVLQKVDCINKVTFLIHLLHIINSATLQDKRYLFAKTNIKQEKNKISLNIFFYAKESHLLSVKNMKYLKFLLKKVKKLKKLRKINKLSKIRKLHNLKKSESGIQVVKKRSKVRKKNLKRNWVKGLKRRKVTKFFINKKKKIIGFKEKNHDKSLPVGLDFYEQNTLNSLKKTLRNKKKKSFFFRKLRLGLKKVNIKLKRKFFGKIKKEFLSNVYKINFFLDLKKVEAYFENKFCSSFYTKERKSYFLKKLRVYFLCKNKKKFIKYFLLTKFLVNNKKNIVSSKENTFIYIKKRCGTYRLQYTNLKKKNSLAHTNCRDTLVKVKLGLLNKKRVGFKNFIVELLTLEKAILLITKKYFMQNLSVNFFFINNYNYTAQVLVNYICIKLKQKFTLNQVIRPLIKYLTKLIKKRYLFGFRIMLNGRFTRKQRATKMVLKGGSVPLATLDNNVDYFEDFVSLKDGVGGIKIWLNRTIKAKKACIGIKSN